MQNKVPCYVKKILDKLNESGYEAYMVGGCVRDILLGIPPKDYDVTTSAHPHEVKQILTDCKVLDTGIAHGTVTAILDDQAIEITTYRIDGIYSDNRHPDKVTFASSLQEDLMRRDFTINAMAFHPKTGLHDYFGGQKDLANHLLRCVGEPDSRFKEDALRIVRALRFSSQLKFSIEEQTAQSLIRNRFLLTNVAKERISTELLKLLCGKNAQEVLLKYKEVFAEIISQLKPLIGFMHHSPYHNDDVYEHTVKSLAQTEAEPILRLTMLLHDIGKPDCFYLDENGRGHFPNHSKAGAAKAEKILRELRLDRNTISTVAALVYYHDTEIEPDFPCVKRWMDKLTPALLKKLMLVKIADHSAKNLVYTQTKQKAEEVLTVMEKILEKDECYCLKQLKINGDNLLKLGVTEGRQIGELLKFLLDAVITGEIENNLSDLMTGAERFLEKNERARVIENGFD